MNTSTSFLTWIIGKAAYNLLDELISVYVGNIEYEGEPTWGEYVYYHVENTISAVKLRELREHPQYVTEYDPDEKSIMLIFKPTEDQKKKVIYRILEGQYSKVDRKYVNEYFREYLPSGKESNN